MSNKKISEGIVLDCVVFNESIGAEKDLVLVNYSDFDLEATSNPSNRQTDDSLNNLRGLTDIFLKEGAEQYIFEGTDYSVVPTVTPESREDGNLWYIHSLAFTVYSKKAKDRETLLSLSGSRVVAITKDRSTGLYELFGMYQGLRVTGIDRTYIGAQNSNFYQVTIATPEINVIKEPFLSELSIYLNGGTILPPTPTPGVYGDATPTVQGLVRVDTLRLNPIVYTVESADYKFEQKTNKVTTAAQVEFNKTSTVKYASLKAIVDWIVALFEPILNSGTIGQYYRGDKTWQTLNARTIGLENVDNTSDLDKPISNMTQLALDQIDGNNFNTFREITLTDLGVATFAEVTDVLVQDYIDGLGITQLKGETNYFKVVENTLNFDITADWVNNGVTDEASFISFLSGGFIPYYEQNNLINIVVTDFSLVNGRLICNLNTNGYNLYFFDTAYSYTGFNVTNVNKFKVDGVNELYLNANQLTVFNPIIPLPTSLGVLNLRNNQLTTASYTEMEQWANSQPAFTDTCNMYFGGNPDSITGTNLEAILLTKNVFINA